ncbi:MAG: hypothetical protein JEZ06_19310 [Anaerolineaceae bacterium]|nr:hypothetical protein [Anaerolineaceae bacterium]
MVKNIKQFLVVLIAIIFLVSCAQVDSGPRAWIDFPEDGSLVRVGEPVNVISHGYAEKGIDHVLLSVNGAAVREDLPAEPDKDYSSASQSWTPTEADEYILEVVIYDRDGNMSKPASIRLKVVSQDFVLLIPSDTPTPTQETPTPVISITPTETIHPTITATSTSTPTNVIPAEVNFWADASSITSGECTTLHWTTQNANIVTLDGSEVGLSDNRQVCPTASTTYNLRVLANSGTLDRQIIISVTAPGDTTPPPVPQPMVPADGLVIGCTSSQTLAWLPVTDPSGLDGYTLRLEKDLGSGTWQLMQEWTSLADKQVNAPVDCGLSYRWKVRARDTEGNQSNYSAYSHFSVELD